MNWTNSYLKMRSLKSYSCKMNWKNYFYKSCLRTKNSYKTMRNFLKNYCCLRNWNSQKNCS